MMQYGIYDLGFLHFLHNREEAMNSETTMSVAIDGGAIS